MMSSRENAFTPQQCAAVGHGMRAGGESCAGVVGVESFVGRHRVNRHRRVRLVDQMACVAQQGTNRTASLFHLPERIASMFDAVQHIQRADASQRDKLFAVARGDAKREIFDGCEQFMAVRASRRDSTDTLRSPFA